MSIYNLDEADPDRVRQMFDLFEAEGRMLLGKGLPLPAYSYVLKTSHTFNILDARGAIGIAERARYFARMRDLARDVATSWIEMQSAQSSTTSNQYVPRSVKPMNHRQLPDAPEDFVLEIGSEELPHVDMSFAATQLHDNATLLFAELGLAHGGVTVHATPRRLVLAVSNLSPGQKDEETFVKGPPLSICFDAAGNPTKAALGFATSQKVDVDALVQREIDGREYKGVLVKSEGLPTPILLARHLPDLIGSIAFPKAMRWNSSNVPYSRPVRWILALYGDDLVPFEFAMISSDRYTYGLRNGASSKLRIESASSYLNALEEEGIIVSHDDRESLIWDAGEQLAQKIGGKIPHALKDALLGEVADLVETPTPIRGAFDSSFLSLPHDVLTTVMQKHQRYFPIEDDDGYLLPHFVTIANGKVDADTVRSGNEAVIRARLADAQFFWERDSSRPLESFRANLGSLTFHERLGSMYDKTKRLEAIVPELSKSSGFSAGETEVASRAAALAKADLVTEMVVEFTSLTGVMGMEYARLSGEQEEVAIAIFEHVLPRYATDILPASKPGILLSIIDRLDSLVGLFAAGATPRATADPFGLRRLAVGMLRTMVERDVLLDLDDCIDKIGAVQPVPVTPSQKRDLIAFITTRLEQLFTEGRGRHDLIEAVLATCVARPAVAAKRLRQLQEIADTEQFQRFLTSYSRPTRIVRKQEVEGELDPGLFRHKEETKLWEAYSEAEPHIEHVDDVSTFVQEFEVLVDPIDEFFTKVFVMDKDRRVRNNRLLLLQKIENLANGFVDFTKIQGF